MFDAIPVLSSAECERVRQTVHALRSSWIVRGSADHPFYTVGAASYIDAVSRTPPPRYSEILVETNPVLREHFHWLYARLMNKLSVHLQAVVRTADELALPGFHVWQGLSVPTSSLSIHFDLQYMSIPWPDVSRSDRSLPLSFTLPIALPRGGGGLNTWDLSYEEQAAHFQATRKFTPVGGDDEVPDADVSPLHARRAHAAFRAHAAPDRGGRSGISRRRADHAAGPRPLLRRRVDDLLVRTSRPTSLASLPGGVDQELGEGLRDRLIGLALVERERR